MEYDEYVAGVERLFSREAEQSVIGAIFLDEELFDDVASVLCSDDFYFPQHKALWDSFVALHGKSPIDAVTVSEHIDNNICNLDYIVEVASNTPSSANAMSYAKIVKERSQERGLFNCADKIKSFCLDSTLSHQERLEQSQIAYSSLSTETKADTQKDLNQLMEASLDSIDRRLHGSEDLNYVKTGLSDVDKRIHGYRPADLVLIGARPSMGKTTIMTNWMIHQARHHGPVMAFSLEMTGESLMDRMIASSGSVHLDFLRNPAKVTPNSQENWSKITTAVTTMKDLPIFIDEQGGLSVYELKNRARRQHRKTPLKAIWVDYLGKLNDGHRRQADNRNSEISVISSELKLLAKELNVPVFALSQLNRGLESRTDKRPKNSDLRDSGSLEQDADVIHFLYRDEVYDPNSSFNGVMEIITTKFRDGEIGTDRAEFLGQYNQVRDLDAAKYIQQEQANHNSGFRY